MTTGELQHLLFEIMYPEMYIQENIEGVDIFQINKCLSAKITNVQDFLSTLNTKILAVNKEDNANKKSETDGNNSNSNKVCQKEYTLSQPYITVSANVQEQDILPTIIFILRASNNILMKFFKSSGSIMCLYGRSIVSNLNKLKKILCDVCFNITEKSAETTVENQGVNLSVSHNLAVGTNIYKYTINIPLIKDIQDMGQSNKNLEDSFYNCIGELIFFITKTHMTSLGENLTVADYTKSNEKATKIQTLGNYKKENPNLFPYLRTTVQDGYYDKGTNKRINCYYLPMNIDAITKYFECMKTTICKGKEQDNITIGIRYRYTIPLLYLYAEIIAKSLKASVSGSNNKCMGYQIRKNKITADVTIKKPYRSSKEDLTEKDKQELEVKFANIIEQLKQQGGGTLELDKSVQIPIYNNTGHIEISKIQLKPNENGTFDIVWLGIKEVTYTNYSKLLVKPTFKTKDSGTRDITKVHKVEDYIKYIEKGVAFNLPELACLILDSTKNIQGTARVRGQRKVDKSILANISFNALYEEQSIDSELFGEDDVDVQKLWKTEYHGEVYEKDSVLHFELKSSENNTEMSYVTESIIWKDGEESSISFENIVIDIETESESSYLNSKINGSESKQQGVYKITNMDAVKKELHTIEGILKIDKDRPKNYLLNCLGVSLISNKQLDLSCFNNYLTTSELQDISIYVERSKYFKGKLDILLSDKQKQKNAVIPMECIYIGVFRTLFTKYYMKAKDINKSTVWQGESEYLILLELFVTEFLKKSDCSFKTVTANKTNLAEAIVKFLLKDNRDNISFGNSMNLNKITHLGLCWLNVAEMFNQIDIENDKADRNMISQQVTDYISNIISHVDRFVEDFDISNFLDISQQVIACNDYIDTKYEDLLHRLGIKGTKNSWIIDGIVSTDIVGDGIYICSDDDSEDSIEENLKFMLVKINKEGNTNEILDKQYLMILFYTEDIIQKITTQKEYVTKL